MLAFMATASAAISGCRCNRDTQGTTTSASASASAIGSAKPAPSPAELKAAEDAVVEYYAALDTGDCDAVIAALEKPVTKADCTELVEEWHDHKVRLDRVLKVAPDGRDRTVVLVTIRVSSMKGPLEQTVRARYSGASWKVDP